MTISKEIINDIEIFFGENDHIKFEIVPYSRGKISNIFKKNFYVGIWIYPYLLISQGLILIQVFMERLNAGFPGVAVTCCGNGTPGVIYSLKTHYEIHSGYGQPSEKHDYNEIIEECVNHGMEVRNDLIFHLWQSDGTGRPWEAPGWFGKRG